MINKYNTDIKEQLSSDKDLKKFVSNPTIVPGYKVNILIDDTDVVYDLKNGITWEFIARGAAGGVAGAIAGEVVVSMLKRTLGLNVNYEQLFNNAINEIVNQLGRVIDNAFLREYLADIEHMRSELLTYAETKELRILHENREHASKIVHRLMGFNAQEGLGGFLCAANLHLMVIKALAGHNGDYKKTLQRKCKDYAAWAEHSANLFLERVKTSVSPCESHCHEERDPGGGRLSLPLYEKTKSPCNCNNENEKNALNVLPRDNESLYVDTDDTVCSYSFKHNYGRDERRFGPRYNYADCDRARQTYYDSAVNPATDRRNRILDICNLWRAVNIDDIRTS
ncbi:MAG TPA: hypothetical protein VLB82_03140 [Thermodesulfobacteriota bacterium]|nr:hypothetical protein [Thermodesulfobacteriota bacterium]